MRNIYNDNLLTVKNLTVFIDGTRALIDDLNFVLNRGDKIAVIGEEGNGKSTLLKIIAEKKLAENILFKANIDKKITRFGYLPQEIDRKFLEMNIGEFLVYDDVSGKFVWEKYNDIAVMVNTIRDLGFEDNLIEKDLKLKNFSGGERVRLFMAKILMDRPEVLLLDEPTNDLDIQTIEWLENIILEFQGGILYVSHDIAMLRKTASHILHLYQEKNKTVSKYFFGKIGYDEYVEFWSNKFEIDLRESARQKRKYKKQMGVVKMMKSRVRQDQENIIDSSARRLLNKRMKTLLSQEKKLNKEELLKKPEAEEMIRMNLEVGGKSNTERKIIEWQNEDVGFDNRFLIRGVNLEIYGGDRICFVGNNGCGKTTLLKKIGEYLQEKNIDFGYFPQNIDEYFVDKSQSPIDYIMAINEEYSETFARSTLGRIKFTPEEMLRKVVNLSGGQKVKLIWQILVLKKHQVWLLDEPTRNLSVLSLPVIYKLIGEYEGCLIVASHDRELVGKQFSQIYQIEKGKLKQVFAEGL